MWEIGQSLVSDGLRIDIIKRKSEYFQNKEGPFEVIQRAGEHMKERTDSPVN